MKEKPRLCFVGNMLGQNAGHVTTQGQITAELFARSGYEVTAVSRRINRMARVAEIAFVLVRNRRRFDIVILEVYSGLAFILADAASMLCKLLRLRLVMVLHGGNLPAFAKKYRAWTKRILARADRLTAPSAFLASQLGRTGFDIGVIPNVIDLDLYPFKERRRIFPRLIWMRSFHATYYPEMAIKVLAELRKKFPAATLTMAGVDKGLEPSIRRLADEMNLSEAVNFPGFLNTERKARLFAESDIFINTNRVDNMPVAVLEACAFGLPVVSTNVGGLPFLISHRKNGLLVEKENVEQMADAIELLLNDADLAASISMGGRHLAERSAWTSVRSLWEEIFSEILKERLAEPSAEAASGFMPKNRESAR